MPVTELAIISGPITDTLLFIQVKDEYSLINVLYHLALRGL